MTFVKNLIVLTFVKRPVFLTFVKRLIVLTVGQEALIHGLIEKRRGVPHMTLKGLALLILPQVD